MSKTGHKVIRGKKLLISAKNQVKREKISPPIASGCSHSDQNYCSIHHDTT
jgi:hypothetical protein